MRQVFAVTIALLALAPIAAAASPTDPYTAIDQMRATFSRVQSVQIVERFADGAIATVQLTPPATSAAAASTSKRQLLIEYASQPGGELGRDVHDLFTITPLGHKTLYGVAVDGYQLIDQAGAVETVWVNSHHLPVTMHVVGYGDSVDVMYGNYNNPTFFATKP